jgi:hypothetical protein
MICGQRIINLIFKSFEFNFLESETINEQIFTSMLFVNEYNE